jgi:hypothetical protein
VNDHVEAAIAHPRASNRMLLADRLIAVPANLAAGGKRPADPFARGLPHDEFDFATR